MLICVVAALAFGVGPADPKEPQQSSIPAVSLPLDNATVRTADEPGDQGVFARLARGVVAVLEVPGENRVLAVTYALGAAPLLSEFQPPRFNNGSTVHVLSVGPLLDSPDTVTVKHCRVTGDAIELLVENTQMRLEGASFRRNHTRRPMVAIPLKLKPGNYVLTAVWQIVPGLPKGQPLQGELTVKHQCRFTIDP